MTAGTGGTPYPATLGILQNAEVFNLGVGGENSTQIKTRFLSDVPKQAYYTLIWSGRNNSFDPTTVKADIAAMVAALPHAKYVVLEIENGTAEPAGSGPYVTMMQLNADLQTIYGAHYLNVRTQLVALYNPGIPQDVIDHGNDVPPSSLRFDALHLNTAGYTAVANIVNAYIQAHP